MTFDLKAISFLVLANVALSGCVSAEERAAAFEKRQQINLVIKEKEEVFRAEISKMTPTCQSKADCDAKMEAAYAWVSKNADYKIRSSSNVIIETYGPSHADGDVAAIVEKAALGNGKYAIIASLACKNSSMLAAYSPMTSCKTNTLQKTIEFNNFVNSY